METAARVVPVGPGAKRALVVRRATAARVVPVVPEAEQGPAVRQERVVRRVLEALAAWLAQAANRSPTGHYCFDLIPAV